MNLNLKITKKKLRIQLWFSDDRYGALEFSLNTQTESSNILLLLLLYCYKGSILLAYVI